jgi:hypothetical protein
MDPPLKAGFVFLGFKPPSDGRLGTNRLTAD